MVRVVVHDLVEQEKCRARFDVDRGNLSRETAADLTVRGRNGRKTIHPRLAQSG